MSLVSITSRKIHLWRWSTGLLLAITNMQVQADDDCTLATTKTRAPYSVACGA